MKNKLIKRNQDTVGDDEVLMGTSGGVDSTVAAVLVHEAIGKKLHCVFNRSRPH
jgi:GMP synthase (glutamine-hydrolysing)